MRAEQLTFASVAYILVAGMIQGAACHGPASRFTCAQQQLVGGAACLEGLARGTWCPAETQWTERISTKAQSNSAKTVLAV